ncbi:MAG TPA: DUF5309 family protein [Steroidobacteraceae bacterium]
MALASMGATPAGTYLEPTAVGVREDLADIIYRIDPDETPLTSACSRVGSKQVMTEWLVQELNAAYDNFQPEGFTAVMQAATKPVRLNNICQIIAHTVGVSNTLRVVDVAGGEDEYNRQLILRGMECKRDLELAITSPLVRTITDPRHMSGLPAYCSKGIRGATGTMPVGDGSGVGTAGTLFDLTLDTVQQAMQQCWQAGGKPDLGIMSGAIKLYFATLSQGGTANAIVAQNIVQASPRDQMTIQGAVDVFRTDFGTLQLAPDRFCPAHQVLLVTTDYIELAPLPQRDMVQQDYAQTGDNSQGGVVFEGTLRPTAPKAHAYIADLNQ